MLSYPDPLGRKALAAAFDDGHDIAPAAYLAVKQINNRSDLLSDYRVKLLPLDGDCTVAVRTAIGMNDLACSCKPIVGIVGPTCSASALLVGQFTGRNQFPMITLHYAERNILGNREMFPYAFGMLGANLITIKAFTDLIVWNDWTRVVLLYSADSADLVELSTGIEKNIKGVPGFDIAFTSPIYDHYIPLREVKQSLARVIFLLATVEATLRTLCVAYHEGMIFPKYQWVFKERFENDFTNIRFIHDRIHYFCTDEDISKSIYKSVNFVWSLGGNGAVDGPLNSLEYISEYEEGYDKQRRLYENKFNVSSMAVEWARGIYDAVWSLAFALNNSLNDLNMSLTEVVPGSKKLAQAIARHMISDVKFQGVSGRIDFDNDTGFNTARQINIYQFGAAKSRTLIGFHTPKEHITLSNETTPQFIMPMFTEKYTRVSVAVAATFLIIHFASLLLILPTQIINILYRNHPSIKATSPKLNHLIFLGFYLILVGMILYTITEAWPQSLNTHMLLNTCITQPWFLNIGTTLVIGTVCAKTWRLYCIYISSMSGVRLNSKRVADRALIGYVGIFTSVDALLCLLWTCIDPPEYMYTRTVPESKTPPMVTITGSCQFNWLVYWTSVQILYKCVTVVCTFFLALRTKLKKKEFTTNNVIILSYILTIAVGLGIPIYVIIYIADVSVLTQFIIASVFVDTIIYICLFTLFLPSIISLIIAANNKYS
jgi:gamma-aminobutyric acid type B receptor